MNKKADVATTLLVIMAVVLAAAASIIFISDSGKLETKIADARFLENIYLKEGEINFYINEILENSVKNFDKDKGEASQLIENFTKELGEYMNKDGNYIAPELGQIESQINEEHIKYDKNNKIATAEFQISLEDKVVVDKKELFSAVYTYKKKFEKQL